jgi:hypothetical protein
MDESYLLPTAMFLKNLYLIIQGISVYGWNKNTSTIRHYELAKSIILEAGIAVAGELSVQSKEKWKTLQSKYS